MGEIPTPQQPVFDIDGEHRPATRVACGLALVLALTWAAFAGMVADQLVVLNDPNFDTGHELSLSKRITVTAAATLVVGAIRFWLAWRACSAAVITWNEGGLAYRESAKVHGAIP